MLVGPRFGFCAPEASRNVLCFFTAAAARSWHECRTHPRRIIRTGQLPGASARCPPRERQTSAATNELCFRWPPHQFRDSSTPQFGNLTALGAKRLSPNPVARMKLRGSLASRWRDNGPSIRHDLPPEDTLDTHCRSGSLLTTLDTAKRKVRRMVVEPAISACARDRRGVIPSSCLTRPRHRHRLVSPASPPHHRHPHPRPPRPCP